MGLDTSVLIEPVFAIAVIGTIVLAAYARKLVDNDLAPMFRSLASSCSMIVLVYIGIALSMPYIIVVFLLIIAVLFIFVTIWQSLNLRNHSRRSSLAASNDTDIEQ